MSDAGPHEPGSATAVGPARPPVRSRSDAALDDYARRMRPLRAAYAIAIAVAVAVALVLVKIAYGHGEISHVTLHTVDPAPASISPGATKTGLTQAWTSTDTTAIGNPIDGGTVVTHDRHTVRGRDGLTGRQTWSYTRTDRDVCTAIQTQSVTIAVYQLHGNCDELTALDSSTGERRWTRTLDKDTAEFDGPATYTVRDGNVLFATRTSVYSVAPGGTADAGNGGLDYWTFHHAGCTINGAVLGSAGALISQTCSGQKCDGHKFCGDGTQLLLRDATAKYDDNSSTNKNNPDSITWNDFGTNLVPTSAGATVTARTADGATLHVFDAANGKQTAQFALAGHSKAGEPSAFASTSDADLIWIGDRTYALPQGASSPTWRARTIGPVTITSTDDPSLDAAVVLAPTAAGVARLDTVTGRPSTSYGVHAPARSAVFALGTGLLVAGAGTTVYR